MARLSHIVWNRITNWLIRPKRLAIFEACLIGLVSGIAALLLGECVSWLGGWRRATAHLYYAYYVLPAIGLIGGFLAGWLVERFAPAASGSGMTEVKAVLSQVPMPLTLRIALIKLVSAALILGAGMPLGKEGPTVQIGAALANQLSHWFPTSPDHRRQLIAAGAGAGLAAAFNAPIAGVLFVVEELLQDVSGITLGTAILASLIASVVARITGSHSLDLDLHLATLNTSFVAQEIPFYLLLGILSGLLGVLFNRGILVSLSLYRRVLTVSLPWKIGFAGLLTGLALTTLPSELRDYTALRTLLITGDANWQLVGFLFCFQFVLIIVTYGSGAPGGLLVPSLTLGAALGYVLGTWEHGWMGFGTATTYAQVGMGAFFCGVARVPITGVIIVFEMTTNFNLVLPLMIGSVTAYLVGELVDQGSLYDHLLEFRNIHLSPATNQEAPWTKLTAMDVMQRKVETLPSNISSEEALQTFSQSSHRAFPVMENHRLVGMLTQKDMAKLAQRGSVNEQTVADVMTPEPITTSPDDTLAHVLHLLDHYNISSLPVTAGRRLVGIITRSDIIRVEAAHLSGDKDLDAHKAVASQVIYQTRSPETGQGRILVPISNPQTAPILLQMAIAIARERQYEIECVRILIVPRHAAPAEASVNSMVSQRLLQEAARQGQAWQVPVHTQIRIGHDLAYALLETIKAQHIDLMLMGWKGSTNTSGRVFSRVVDTMIRQATCEVMLVKLSPHPAFNRWLIPMAGGPNAQDAVRLLPGLISLGQKSQVRLLHVCNKETPQPETTVLDREAQFLSKSIKTEVLSTTICANSVADAVLDYAKHDGTDVIMLGASREGLLQQVIQGNVPNAIARNCSCTVILVRKPLT